MGAKAALGVYEGPYTGDALNLAAKYFKFSVETGEEFLELQIAEGLKKKALEHVSFSLDEKQSYVKSLFVRKDVQFRQN